MNKPALAATSNKQQATSNKQQATSNKQRSTTNHYLAATFYSLAIAVMMVAMVKPSHAVMVTPSVYYSTATGWAPAYIYNGSSVEEVCSAATAGTNSLITTPIFLYSINQIDPVYVIYPNVYYTATCDYRYLSLPTLFLNSPGWVLKSIVCPANSFGLLTCECNVGYTTDPTATSCVLVDCPVPALTAPPFNDACAESLDAGLGVDVKGACPKLSDAMNNQIQCFADKITATNATARPPISYSGPTATIRNAAYQAHLRDIWDKLILLNNLSDPAEISACQPRRDEVIAEKGCASSGNCVGMCISGSHCIRHISATDSNHPNGTAFDVPDDTINGLLSELTPLPPAPFTPSQKLQAQRIWVVDWLAKPTACNLYWGGNFTDPGPDYVHFQLP